MGFVCPICIENLERLPSGARNLRGQIANELNITTTPCGHIFHAYCIQKWITGDSGSSKLCPCCRKDVNILRCLSLYPTTYDLDNSVSDGPAAVAPCNHGELITSLENQVTQFREEVKQKDKLYDLTTILKNQVARLQGGVKDKDELITSLKDQVIQLQEEVKDKDDLYEILSADFSTLEEKFRTEKMTSNTLLRKTKEYEIYRDLADELEARAEKTDAKLKNYKYLEKMIKGVKTSVNQELDDFPTTKESIRSLLETRHVLAAELRKANQKVKDLNYRYKDIREENVKFEGLYEKNKEIVRVNGRVRSLTPMTCSSNALLDEGAVPKAFRPNQRLQESLQSTGSKRVISPPPPGTHADVDVFQPSFKIKKAKSTKVLTSQPQQEKKEATVVKSKTNMFPCALSFSPILAGDVKTKAQPQNSTINLCSDSSYDDDRDIADTEDDEFNENFRIRGNVPGAPLPIAAARMKNLQQKSEKPILGLTSKTKKFPVKKL